MTTLKTLAIASLLVAAMCENVAFASGPREREPVQRTINWKGHTLPVIQDRAERKTIDGFEAKDCREEGGKPEFKTEKHGKTFIRFFRCAGIDRPSPKDERGLK